MRRILVAFDGSPPAERALRLASEIAGRFGARITLLYVLEPIRLPPEATGVALDQLERQHHEYAGRLLAEASGTVSGVQSDTAILHGSAAEAIAAAAEAEEVDLVALGSHGRGALARAFLGSVSSRLVHICKKPLLVVR